MEQASTEYQKYLAKKQQIAALEAETKLLLQALLENQISEIKSKIKEFDIKPGQIFSASELSKSKGRTTKSMDQKIIQAKSSAKASTAVKYRGPNGETWSGGRGRKPAWIQKILDAGGAIEKYRSA